jgi:Holliday junction resolvase RusA-like endonuclease
MSEPTVIRLEVLGAPTAQPRHKHFTRGKFTGTYDPASAKKNTFASCVQDDAPLEPLNKPLIFEVTFYMPRPKGHYGTGKKAEMLRDDAPEWHTSRGDLDNQIKFCTDALNGIFYKDDALICSIIAKKIYSERPRTEIIITTL